MDLKEYANNAGRIQVHPTSIVDRSAAVGDGTKIWHFCHVQGSVGDNCMLGQGCYVGDRAIIGNNVKIQNNVSIFSGVAIEDDVFVGPSVVFTNVKRPKAGRPVCGDYYTTLIRKGATIGANATIICGVTVGKYAFVGAGAVVTEDVLDYALVVGNPAKFAGWICQCGSALMQGQQRLSYECSACEAAYTMDFTRKKSGEIIPIIELKER